MRKNRELIIDIILAVIVVMGLVGEFSYWSGATDGERAIIGAITWAAALICLYRAPRDG